MPAVLRRPRTTALLALLAVGSFLVLPTHAAPSVSAAESAEATFPLEVEGRALQLHVSAEPGRLFLNASEEGALRQAALVLGDDELVLTADGATLRTVVADVALDVTWERVAGHLSVRAGSVTAGPHGADYRGGGGDHATATLTLAGGPCAADAGTLGRSVNVTTDDTRSGNPADVAAVLRVAACGDSTTVTLPPQR